MQLERLQIDLRPRKPAQALDLGFALLRLHWRDTYAAFLALLVPLLLLALAAQAALVHYGSDLTWLPSLLMWWVRPMLERVALPVLARGVFGESMRWHEAVRAWPRQLGGGWFRLLTWWRPFMAGYGLYQPIWQLEQVRGKAASRRLRELAGGGTGFAAWWFGAACVFFELVLCFGLLALVSPFLDDSFLMTPSLEVLFNGQVPEHVLDTILLVIAAVVVAAIAPLYVACTFTLYLNRRSTLEAWDIECVLRELKAGHPVRKPTAAVATLPALLAGVTLALGALLSLAPPVAEAAPQAGPAAVPAECPPPDWVEVVKLPERAPDANAEQARIRATVDEIEAHPDFKLYVCQHAWRIKDRKTTEDAPGFKFNFGSIDMRAFNYLLIALAVALVVWVLYRYRDKLGWTGTAAPRMATEVAGLDIRASSLPDDVAGQALALWDAGERRAALALLYRATLSRLVHQDRLGVNDGATEGDCLRLAEGAHGAGKLSGTRLDLARRITSLWLPAAYGGHWPLREQVAVLCAAWPHEFDGAAKVSA
jgi:hypothetical protein